MSGEALTLHYDWMHVGWLLVACWPPTFGGGAMAKCKTLAL